MHPATIGPFKIERELGRGGMGEVFLALDTRLDRRVAIKALPAHLAQDPDRLARFQREAKVLASLNHPGIGAIYGLEEAQGHQYLILEFIDGETLADRLASGPIPVEEALGIARQIAEALEAAHEKGIIHRDLKPANVMSTPEGVVKVLDFGLARTAEGSPSTTNSPAAAADSPTLPARSPTIPGAIMGTAGYMSPEQARGKPVDKRSDIFSFGCVLFEMLTGAGPFTGETVTDSLGAILHRDPEWNRMPSQVPARVQELIRNCLAKDRRNRLHDIGDARLELERAINGREGPSTATVSAAAEPGRRTSIGAAVLIALVAGGVGWLLASRLASPAPVVPPQAFHVSATLQSKPAFGGVIAISPDSRFLVYNAWPELEPDSTKPEGVLVIRRLDRDETTVIDGTEGARTAALSPDGRWIAFSCAKDRIGSKFFLKKVSLENGRPSGKPETLCELRYGAQYQVGWSSDREILFSPQSEPTIYAVAASGGEPKVIIRDETSESLAGWDSFEPVVPGESILATRFAISGDKVKVNTEFLDLASGKRTLVLPDAGSARLLAAGPQGQKLLVALRTDQTSLIAVGFDPATLRTIGEPVVVWSGERVTQVYLSPRGTLALSILPSDLSDRHLAWLDESGQAQLIQGTSRAYSEMVISPDGGRVLANLEGGTPGEIGSELWMHDLTRRTSTRTMIPGFVLGFLWSPGGQRFTHGAFVNDEFSIFDRPLSGTGEAIKIFTTPAGQQILPQPSAWSPDGKVLAVVLNDMKVSKSDVVMLEQEPGKKTFKASPYLNAAADEHALQFSPDGKWVVFCSVESGRHELYVQRFTGAGSGQEDAKAGRVQISTNGHEGVAWWSRDGKEIRFIDSDKQVVSVDVKTEPAFSVSLPKVLYSVKELKTRNFAWAPDGRLMAILKGKSEDVSRVDLIVDFAAEIQAKMGAK